MSVSTRRSRTHGVVLEAVARSGQVTRGQIAAATGLSRSAVGIAVAQLLVAGALVELESARGQRAATGRPSQLLSVVATEGRVLGVDFGHTHVRAAVADTRGTLVEERTVRVDVDASADDAFAAAGRLAAQVLEAAGETSATLVGMAAGVPGPIDVATGQLNSLTILRNWATERPAVQLAEVLGGPVTVGNDADMGARGEHRFGAAKGYRDFIYVKASHGVGAGIFSDGRCYTGSRGAAGEIGHISLGGMALCRCGRRGCLEAEVSVTEVKRHLATALGDDCWLREDRQLSSAVGHPVADRIFTDAGRAVGRVVADACNWLNPEAVVLGGVLGMTGKPFADGVREAITTFAQPVRSASVDVVQSALGHRAEVLGAVATAIDSIALP